MENTQQSSFSPPKKHSLFKRILFLLIPVAALLFLAESLASIAYFQVKEKKPLALLNVTDYLAKKIKGIKVQHMPEQRHIRLAEQKISFNREPVPPDSYLRDCENLEKKTYHLRTDENGFILPSKIHETPDVTMVFLGGSTTECCFMEEENRFVYKAGRLIEEQSGKKVNAFNGGVSAMSSVNMINTLLNKIIPMKPDYVVLMECVNDLMIQMREKTYWNTHPVRSLVVDPNNPKFTNGKYAGDEWLDTRAKPIVPDTAKMLDNYRRSLETFVAICSNWGIKPVLMTQFNRYTEQPNLKIFGNPIADWKTNGLEYADIRNLYLQMEDVIRNVAARNNILLIDLANQVPQTSEYMHDAVHLTDKGSLLVADIISKKMMNNE